MRLFPRHSVYSWRPLRLLRYRNGHGVHSTYAFRLITEVIRDRYAYYDDAVIKATHSEYNPLVVRLARLLYRLVARLNPQCIIYDLNKELRPPFVYCGRHAAPAMQEIEAGNQSKITEDQTLMVVTDKLESIPTYMMREEISSSDQGISALLVIAPHSTKYRQNRWEEVVSQISQGIIIDLYDAAVIVTKNRHKYIYRGSL